MNIVYEAESARVKGIAFHPKFPWILTSLHNGEILLYDYVHKMLIDKFIEHDGPVRCVDFHNDQPFFVSGGDDKTIKVWNYATKKCQFTLTGHKDYVRSVQFHKELAWILSSSDDMTIRIWNWINRTLLTTASGHDHYVMSAFFHPTQDWIVSASLDSTIRIWDYSVLRKKYYEARSNSFEVIAMDVTMIHKLEGHERGVNWAVFHPTLNLIASASDDKTIKIWKYSNPNWTEADTLRGHLNNVSCVLFHPKLDYLISNSEDKTLRVWDLNKKVTVDKITSENNRYWILGAHPSIFLFAAGSDNGLTVFKMENTRIPSAAVPNNVLFYFNNFIGLWKYGTVEKKQICEIKNKVKGIKQKVVSIIKNPFISDINQAINFILVIDDAKKKKIVHCLLKYDASSAKYTSTENVLELCNSACFLAKNRLLVLLNDGSLISYETNNFDKKYLIDINTMSKEQFHSIYQGPLGKFFLKFKNGIVTLFDVNTKKTISETTEITEMNYVVWNQALTHCALVGGNTIFIVNKNMDIITKIKEKSSIKSVVFDENNVLFYTTYFHVKYSLIEPGLYGIVKSTENPIYLMSVYNSTLYYSNSNQVTETQNINYVDIRFKLNLLNKNYDDIVKILKSGSVYGLKTVENIQKAGFPDLSLKFVNDSRQKFYLALRSGKLEEAKEAAEKLKEKVYFEKLAEKAMLMGKLDIAEFCYVKSQNLDKLIFFYTITGRQDKLKKLELALQTANDNSRRFLNSIYTNNVEEKVNVLNETGHSSLALLTAQLHDREDLITLVTETAKKSGKVIKMNEKDYESIKKNMKPIVPLKPVVNTKNKEYHSNWLTLTEIKKATPQATMENIFSQKEEETQDAEENIFGQISQDKEGEKKEEKSEPKKKINTDKWGDEEEEDDEEMQKMLEEANKKAKLAATTLTQKDDDFLVRSASKSMLPGVQVSLGNFKLAFNYLRSQLGITTNYDSLKPIIKDIYMSSYTQFKLVPYLSPIEFNIRNPNTSSGLLPQNGVTIAKLKAMINKGYDAFSNFEMNEAMKIFRDTMKYAIFFIATSPEEEKTVKDMIYICSEYVYLTKISLLAENYKEKDKVKYCELVCLMSVCKLELSEHKFLIYKKAKYCCKNIKNFITALYFIKKMLPLEQELYSMFKKEFDKIKEEFDIFQKIGTNQHQLEFNINDNLPNIRNFYDSKTIKRTGVSDKVVSCPLCNSVALAENKGNVCDTCTLCTLGEEVIGFKLVDSN